MNRVLCAALLTPFIATMQTQPVRFLALGDSYTIGEGVNEADRWPMQLAQRLRTDGVPVSDPEIIARTGWTTDELDAAITDRKPRGPFGLVTLLIGVNNQYRGRDVQEFRTQLRSLISRAVGFAEGSSHRVVLVGIPDWGVTPFNASRDREQVAREIDGFNAVVRDEAQRAHARFVDITDLTRADPAGVVADGLHPDAAMYGRWTERLAEAARTILRPH